MHTSLRQERRVCSPGWQPGVHDPGGNPGSVHNGDNPWRS